MENEKKELETLTEAINHLEKALSFLVCSDNVTEEEYKKIGEFTDKLIDRKTELQVKIDGCIIEEA